MSRVRCVTPLPCRLERGRARHQRGTSDVSARFDTGWRGVTVTAEVQQSLTRCCTVHLSPVPVLSPIHGVPEGAARFDIQVGARAARPCASSLGGPLPGLGLVWYGHLDAGRQTLLFGCHVRAARFEPPAGIFYAACVAFVPSGAQRSSAVTGGPGRFGRSRAVPVGTRGTARRHGPTRAWTLTVPCHHPGTKQSASCGDCLLSERR